MPSYLALIYLDLVLVYNSSENHYKHIVLQIYSYTIQIQHPVWFTFLIFKICYRKYKYHFSLSWIHPGELLIENKRQSKTKEEETSSEKFFKQNILKENRQAELLFFKIWKDLAIFDNPGRSLLSSLWN